MQVKIWLSLGKWYDAGEDINVEEGKIGQQKFLLVVRFRLLGLYLGCIFLFI